MNHLGFIVEELDPSLRSGWHGGVLQDYTMGVPELHSGVL